MLDYYAYTRIHGFRPLFEQKQAQYAERFPRYPHPTFAEPYRFDSFRALREIVSVARSRHLDLTLIIYPYHAWMMDMFREDGLLESFTLWKRALVHSVNQLDPAVRIFDFSGASTFTLEAVPSTGDRQSHVTWYWEPGHFRPSLGDKIIARIYGGKDAGFGEVLSSVGDATAGTRKEALSPLR